MIEARRGYGLKRWLVMGRYFICMEALGKGWLLDGELLRELVLLCGVRRYFLQSAPRFDFGIFESGTLMD